MKVVHSLEVPAAPMSEDGAANITIRWLISKPDGAPNFAMRLFELAPGGYTPKHTHAWEHEVFVLAGEGELTTAEGPKHFLAGDAVFVAPEELHQFRNTGAGTMRMLCLIPLPE